MSNDTKQAAPLNLLAPTATSRRAFLRTASLTAVGAGALVACGKGAAAAAQKTASAPPVGGHDMAGVTQAGSPVVDRRGAADAMDAMHEKGIRARHVRDGDGARSCEVR